MLVYTGDLGMDAGAPQSVYVARQVQRRPGEEARTASRSGSTSSPGETVELPDGLGSVDLRGRRAVDPDPDQPDPRQGGRAGGVVLALIGLLGSLFIRPRRVWVRARREGEGTLVEVAALDRSGDGDDDGDPRRASSAELRPDGARHDQRRVGDPQRPGDRGGRARLLPGPAGPPRRVGRRCASAVAGGGRRPPTRTTAAASPSPPAAAEPEPTRRGWRSSAGSASCSPLVAVGDPPGRPGRPRHGRGPQPGALGQHVRVHALRHASSSPLLYLALYRQFQLGWMAPIVVGFVRRVADGRRDLAARAGRPADRGADSYWLVIHVVSAIIATGAFTLGGIVSALYLVKMRKRRRRPPARSPGSRRRRRSTGCPTGSTRSVPGVDLRGADHRPDLGAPGLVVVLELGPEGGLGVHHLGRLRRLPARPRDRRLEGPQRRAARAASAWRRCGSTSSGSTTSSSSSQHSYAAPARRGRVRA